MRKRHFFPVSIDCSSSYNSVRRHLAMGRYRLLLSLIPLLFFAACGFFAEEETVIMVLGEGAALLLAPKRTDYDIVEGFNKTEDLKAYISSANGSLTLINDMKNVSITIHDVEGGGRWDPQDETFYKWEKAGRKIVEAEYGGMSASYDVRVWDDLGRGGTGNTGNGPGIDIIWK